MRVLMEFRKLFAEQLKYINPHIPPQSILGKRELMIVRSSVAFSFS